jgi:hypothetical protein
MLFIPGGILHLYIDACLHLKGSFKTYSQMYTTFFTSFVMVGMFCLYCSSDVWSHLVVLRECVLLFAAIYNKE